MLDHRITFLAGEGTSIPSGTPEGFHYRRDGLYTTLPDEAGGTRHLLLADPFEVAGFDNDARVVVRSTRFRNLLVPINPCSPPHIIRRHLAQAAVLTHAEGEVWSSEALVRFFQNVNDATGDLWSCTVHQVG